MGKIMFNLRLVGAAILTMPSIIASGASTEGISVEHLGVKHTFVRVDADRSDYLMIPVEESREDELVNIIVDGKNVGSFYVRMANDKVDYAVPFDLTPYRGKNLILDFGKIHGSENEKPRSEGIGWESLTFTDNPDFTNTEKYRPAYHHTPVYGWMNDPNGMFYKDGKWHLYYQWNPYGSKWQNMTWGHSVSEDLIHWTPMPAAITPDGLGAIFSGSAAVDKTGSAGYGEDAVVAMYTSAGHSQMQSIAHSNDDGTTFEIYAGNPVITLDTEARDPKIFWNEKTGEWNMTLAHALDHETLFFSSPDLKTWTLNGSFGKEGATGGVWECPDLFELVVPETGEKKWVLIVNINPGGPFGGSAIQYFTGDFDGKTFTADTDKNGKVATKWMDYGKDNYALVTWSDAPDNRRVGLGWMSNWEYANDVPTMQFRSANTLPRDLSLFTAPDGEILIASVPSPEVYKIRGKAVASSAFSAGNKAKNFRLPSKNDGIAEITAEIQASNGASLTFTLANDEGENVTLTYNSADHTLTFNRVNSGLETVAPTFPAITTAPTFETDGKINLDIFIDHSSIEVFANDGKSVMTNLIFPGKPYSTLSVKGTGKAKVENLKIYELNL